MRDLGAYNILNDAAAEQARAMERLNSDLGDDAGVTGTIQPLSQAKWKNTCVSYLNLLAKPIIFQVFWKKK